MTSIDPQIVTIGKLNFTVQPVTTASGVMLLVVAAILFGSTLPGDEIGRDRLHWTTIKSRSI